MNHVTLTGTVFQPESRVAKSGMAVLTFRLSYYQGKGKDGKAAYGSIDVTAFDRLAQAWDGQLHDKDTAIVTGHITLDKWEKDGKKYYKHRLIADDIGKQLSLFADSKSNGSIFQMRECRSKRLRCARTGIYSKTHIRI